MKFKHLIVFLILLVSLNTVLGFQQACYDRSEVMPADVVCNYDCCKVCLTDEGYQTLPQNCDEVASCECDGIITPPEPDPDPVVTEDYEELTTRVAALETQVLEHEDEITTLQTLLESLQAVITEIQETLASLLNRITVLEDAPAETLSGCAYDNPACSEGYECVFNECVEIPPETPDGCANNNPACSQGFECVNNACVAVTPDGCEYDNPSCELGYDCVNNECVLAQVPDEEVIYRTNVVSDYSARASEIVLDFDNDGNLDCFEYYASQRSYFSRNPVVIGQTVDGYDIIKYSRDKFIVKTNSNNFIYKSSSDCDTP